MKDLRVVFFGTSSISLVVFNRLIELGLTPVSIVTVPDRPAGRKMVLTPPPAKVWAMERGIQCLQFEKLDDAAVETLKSEHADLFIVASYGKIIPESVLEIPKHGALNVHPSILPKYRGATPMQSAILDDEQHTGVTIIRMDKLMDHGPIIALHEEDIIPWPQTVSNLEKNLGKKGAEILFNALPDYISGKLMPIEQNHSAATHVGKITKEQGEIVLEKSETGADIAASLDKLGRADFLKYCAFEQWPGTYFFIQAKDAALKTSDGENKTAHMPRKMRIKIKNAHFDESTQRMIIDSLVPEGRGEMTRKDFLNFISNL